MACPEITNPLPEDRAAERKLMVEAQLITRGLRDKGVLQSMMEVPRHCFIPSHLQSHAYDDRPLPIGEGQTISQPYIVALMADALELDSEDRVLEIGTGSGYAAAVLSRIVSKVYTVERYSRLAEEAIARFCMLGYDNIKVMVGDGTKGWPEEAPFDGIQVTAGAPEVPQAFFEQLRSGGKLVIPVGGMGFQELLRLEKNPDGIMTRENLCAVRFVPLVGVEGWTD
jgi:protein-L-isoaspartate(D-aspartate) O-methyltransferase